jgi:hypothetical protein
MAHVIGFAWNKAASVGVDVSVFQSAGIYPLSRNRVPGYFFFISDTSETVTFTETAPPDMPPICALCTSGTRSQNVLPISARPSLSTPNTALTSDTPPEAVTLSRLMKIISVPKIPRKYLISEKQLFCSH